MEFNFVRNVAQALIAESLGLKSIEIFVYLSHYPAMVQNEKKDNKKSKKILFVIINGLTDSKNCFAYFPKKYLHRQKLINNSLIMKD